MAEKSKENIKSVVLEELTKIIDQNEIPHGVEYDLVQQFKESTECGYFDERIPHTEACICLYEQSFKYGRADIVIYHVDGSASVIEVKDGTKGYTHTVSGIGQATLYATQLAMSRGAVTKVRRCLMWSSTGDIQLDVLIEIACEKAGVIPLPTASMKKIMACRTAHINAAKRIKSEVAIND